MNQRVNFVTICEMFSHAPWHESTWTQALERWQGVVLLSLLEAATGCECLLSMLGLSAAASSRVLIVIY